MKAYYAILGVDPDATTDQIKAAYRKLALKFHPDKNAGDKYFENQFKQMQEAYNVLANPITRQSYDDSVKNKSNYQYKSTNTDDLTKKYEEQLKRKEEELKKKEQEHQEQLRQTEEETRKRYQTPEQRLAEEKARKNAEEKLIWKERNDAMLKALSDKKALVTEKKLQLKQFLREKLKRENEVKELEKEIHGLEVRLKLKKDNTDRKVAAIIYLVIGIAVAAYFVYKFGIQNIKDALPFTHPNAVLVDSTSPEPIYDSSFTPNGTVPDEKKPAYKSSDLISTKKEVNTKDIDKESTKDKEIATPPAPAQIYQFVETMPAPSFDLLEYLSKNIKYPENAKNANIQGRVAVSFVVNEDGSISDVKVARGIGGGCDDEAKRVIAAMPKWKPGTQNGKAVKVMYTQPISFKLED